MTARERLASRARLASRVAAESRAVLAARLAEAERERDEAREQWGIERKYHNAHLAELGGKLAEAEAAGREAYVAGHASGLAFGRQKERRELADASARLIGRLEAHVEGEQSAEWALRCHRAAGVGDMQRLIAGRALAPPEGQK